MIVTCLDIPCEWSDVRVVIGFFDFGQGVLICKDFLAIEGALDEWDRIGRSGRRKRGSFGPDHS